VGWGLGDLEHTFGALLQRGTCFTGTKVHILTQLVGGCCGPGSGGLADVFGAATGTKVQILTQLFGAVAGRRKLVYPFLYLLNLPALLVQKYKN
jgi:hypothetical protein